MCKALWDTPAEFSTFFLLKVDWLTDKSLTKNRSPKGFLQGCCRYIQTGLWVIQLTCQTGIQPRWEWSTYKKHDTIRRWYVLMHCMIGRFEWLLTQAAAVWIHENEDSASSWSWSRAIAMRSPRVDQWGRPHPCDLFPMSIWLCISAHWCTGVMVETNDSNQFWQSRKQK